MKDRTEQVLQIFKEISAVPRQSGNRKPIVDWMKTWAEAQGFTYKTDAIDNMLILVPATKGYEEKETIILQGHSDMVCEKTPDSDHDFSKDPLDLYTDGEWLKARNTTLGADNGIALALAFDLAVNPEVKHPALEILITSDEEIGLDGANALSPDFLKGRLLINIDSEDEGLFTVGCAGGMDCLFEYKADLEEKKGSLFQVVIDGLTGGHSGMDINTGRGSAVKLLGRMVQDLLTRDEKTRLVLLNSGSGATNAISRQAECTLLSGGSLKTNEEELTRWCAQWQQIFSDELSADPHVKVTIKKGEKGTFSCLTAESGKRLADLITATPHGVLGMSREIEGLVETSTNLAAVLTEEKEGDLYFHFATSQRSSVMSRLKEITSRVEAIARLADCRISTKNKYPAWQPDWDSALLAKAKMTYKTLFDRDAKVEVIHAGLETGVIGAKYPGMDMISMGPTVRNPHSPDEKLLIPTIKRVYILLSGLME